jgi:hypothetical protein
LENLKQITNSFTPTSLKEMDGVTLQNRTDTKFIFNINKLSEILESVINNYKILEINSERILNYKTQYFDTKNYDLYLNHQNTKLNRYKIRQREYLISNISFFEIKFKSNKERTIKKRIKTSGLENHITPIFEEFIKKNSPYNGTEFTASIINSFSRITLVHNTDFERITIDVDLKFEKENNSIELPFLVIVEVKREGYAKSDFINILKENKIYSQGMSKYSVGTLLLNKNLKYNNFKEKLLKLKKIAQNDKFDSIFNRN